MELSLGGSIFLLYICNMKENIHTKIRDYIRANPHYTDDIIAEKFDVSNGSVSANRAHITMGTDTDDPQARASAVRQKGKKGITLIKAKGYELRINEDGQYLRIDLILKKVARLTDDQAKAIMLTEIQN
jgi:hypothetical protein